MVGLREQVRLLVFALHALMARFRAWWYYISHQCTQIAKFIGANMGAHLGPVGPRYAPFWPNELCYQGNQEYGVICIIRKSLIVMFSLFPPHITCWRHGMEALSDLLVLCDMMTSSNGNIFRVTGPLCGEFTGHRWIPLTKASDAELWCFLWSAPE